MGNFKLGETSHLFYNFITAVSTILLYRMYGWRFILSFLLIPSIFAHFLSRSPYLDVTQILGGETGFSTRSPLLYGPLFLSREGSSPFFPVSTRIELRLPTLLFIDALSSCGLDFFLSL